MSDAAKFKPGDKVRYKEGYSRVLIVTDLPAIVVRNEAGIPWAIPTALLELVPPDPPELDAEVIAAAEEAVARIGEGFVLGGRLIGAVRARREGLGA